MLHSNAVDGLQPAIKTTKSTRLTAFNRSQQKMTLPPHYNFEETDEDCGDWQSVSRNYVARRLQWFAYEVSVIGVRYSCHSFNVVINCSTARAIKIYIITSMGLQ